VGLLHLTLPKNFADLMPSQCSAPDSTYSDTFLEVGTFGQVQWLFHIRPPMAFSGSQTFQCIFLPNLIADSSIFHHTLSSYFCI
jgi:hypothetical protein